MTNLRSALWHDGRQAFNFLLCLRTAEYQNVLERSTDIALLDVNGVQGRRPNHIIPLGFIPRVQLVFRPQKARPLA